MSNPERERTMRGRHRAGKDGFRIPPVVPYVPKEQEAILPPLEERTPILRIGRFIPTIKG